MDGDLDLGGTQARAMTQSCHRIKRVRCHDCVCQADSTKPCCPLILGLRCCYNCLCDHPWKWDIIPPLGPPVPEGVRMVHASFCNTSGVLTAALLPLAPWKCPSGPIQLHLDLWQGSRSLSLLCSVSSLKRLRRIQDFWEVGCAQVVKQVVPPQGRALHQTLASLPLVLHSEGSAWQNLGRLSPSQLPSSPGRVGIPPSLWVHP